MVVRRVVIDDRPHSRRNPQRELEREEQPRTIRIGNALEPRISAADEQLLADQAEEAREAELRRQAAVQNAEVARLARVAMVAVGRLGDGLQQVSRIDGRTRKDLQRIRELLERIRERHTLPA